MTRDPWRCEEADAHLLRILAAPDDEAAERGRRWIAAVELESLPPARSQLLPQLWLRLRDLGVTHARMARLRGVHRQNWYRNQVQISAARPALDALARAGVVAAPLGGLALLPAYGGDWGAPPMRCVEILIDAGSVRAAAGTLAAHGWSPVGRAPDSLAGAYASARASHLFRSREGFGLLLHWRLFDWGITARPQPVLRASETVAGQEGVPCAAVSALDLLLHVCALDPTRQPAAPLWMADALRVVRAAPPDWDAFHRRARECRVAGNVGRALNVIAFELGERIPAVADEGGDCDAVLARLHRPGAAVAPALYRLVRLTARWRRAPARGGWAAYLGEVWGVRGTRAVTSAAVQRAARALRAAVHR